MQNENQVSCCVNFQGSVIILVQTVLLMNEVVLILFYHLPPDLPVLTRSSAAAIVLVLNFTSTHVLTCAPFEADRKTVVCFQKSLNHF